MHRVGARGELVEPQHDLAAEGLLPLQRRPHDRGIVVAVGGADEVFPGRQAGGHKLGAQVGVGLVGQLAHGRLVDSGQHPGVAGPGPVVPKNQRVAIRRNALLPRRRGIIDLPLR